MRTTILAYVLAVFDFAHGKAATGHSNRDRVVSQWCPCIPQIEKAVDPTTDHYVLACGPTRLAALIPLRIAPPIRLGIEQGVQRLLHGTPHHAVEVALDPLVVNRDDIVQRTRCIV